MGVLAAGHGLNAMAGGFVYPFLAVHLSGLAGRSSGALAVGTLFAMSTLLSALGRIVGGELADRRGRRAVLLGAVAGRSVLLAAMAATVHQGAPLVVVAIPFLLSSIARGGYEPAADALVADLVPQPDRPRAYATMRIARNAGWAVGPALGGLAGASRFATLALVAALLGFVSLALFARFLVESAHVGRGERFRLRDLAMALRDSSFRRHCLLTCGLFMLFAQLLVSVSIDLASRVGLNGQEIGWAYTLNGVMVVALQTAVTRIASPVPPARMLAIGALLYGFGYLLVGKAWNLLMALAGVAVVTAGEMVTLPLSAAVAADIAPPDRRGRYLGAYGVFVDVGHGAGQVLGGFGLAAASAHPLSFWWAVAIFSIGVAAGYLRYGARISAADAAG